MPRYGEAEIEYRLLQRNTYSIKEELKEMGARWDAQMKGWRVPADRYDEAEALLEEAEEAEEADGGSDNYWNDYKRRMGY